jgi:hypothetical protein
MKQIFSLAVLALIFLGPACAPKKGKKEKAEKYEMSFEPSEEWQNMELTKKHPNAHSGSSVCEVDSSREFGITFVKKLGAFHKGVPKGMKAGMWVRLDEPSKETSLVMAVEQDGKVLQWESMSLKPLVKKASTWFEISTLFSLKPQSPESAVLKLYLWNQGKQHLLIDDVVIKPQY